MVSCCACGYRDPLAHPKSGAGRRRARSMGPRQVECFLFVNSVNGFALRTDWANFVCLSSPSFDSARNYFLFDFLPPDLLESPPPPLDFLSDFLLEDFLSLLSFLSEDFLSLPLLSDPFLPFFGFSASPAPPDGAPPPLPPDWADEFELPLDNIDFKPSV